MVKLYRSIIRHEEHDSELYTSYEAAISNYTITSVMDRRIDSNLAMLYDSMILPGMIDRKAAEILPDIFKCRCIQLVSGHADYLIVSYPGMRNGMRSKLIYGMAYVPVYFSDAELRFYVSADNKEVTEDVQFTSRELFHAPEILRKCFELAPDHQMLLLSAAREISERGIQSEEEKLILIRALDELYITEEFRQVLLGRLLDLDEDVSWIRILRKEDFGTELGSRLFGLLVKNGENQKAFDVLGICGYENVKPADIAELMCRIIEIGAVPAEEGAISPYFIGLAKYLYDNGQGGLDILRFLAKEYEGSSDEMYGIMRNALAANESVYVLPEKIMMVKLFADSHDYLDETFEAYIKNCKYTDLVLRAYFTVRCSQSFLREEKMDGILFDALDSYAQAVEDPLDLPLIYQLALTKYYSDLEKLDEKQEKICQVLSDALVAQGLVFCYTKQLRKKIRIPEDIIRRFYVEYHAATDAAPKMLARVLPDEEEYHVVDMKKVYKNIYVMSTILFKGDELQYIIYDSAFEKKAAEEGFITVKKYHKQNDDVFEALNMLNKAIEEKDIAQMKEIMLQSVERDEIIKELFTLEK